MVVIDYRTDTAYDLWHVATVSTGTVAFWPGGSMHIGWGDAARLNGSGRSPGATGSGMSHLYGMIRIYEPGGSGPSPYRAGGLKWDYHDMKAIPWGHLDVAAR